MNLSISSSHGSIALTASRNRVDGSTSMATRSVTRHRNQMSPATCRRRRITEPWSLGFRSKRTSAGVLRLHSIEVLDSPDLTSCSPRYSKRSKELQSLSEGDEIQVYFVHTIGQCRHGPGVSSRLIEYGAFSQVSTHSSLALVRHANAQSRIQYWKWLDNRAYIARYSMPHWLSEIAPSWMSSLELMR